jgi:methionine synthase I (cobalamin-dependent)/5,10-methylenetetrahydrofolate reductase
VKKDFRQRLREGPILCDGAMGTVLDLYEYADLPHDIQNLKNPDIVERIHREYIEAGAEIVQTNTFSANRFRLQQYHLDERHDEINIAGVEIARRAAGENVYVAGSVGPTGKLLEPLGKVRRQEARDAFRNQINILARSGVDLLILETFVSLSELDEAIDAAKEVTDLPIVAQKTFPEDGSILSGSFPVEVVDHLLSKGVDVVGANCTVGPQRMFSIIRSMYTDRVALSAQPAAGIPTLLNGRSIYHASPEYLSQYARELVTSGVTLIGACCGSTPAHIREIRKVLDGLRPDGWKKLKEEMVRVQTQSRTPPSTASAELQAVGSGSEHPSEPGSDFGKGLGKRFLVSVELDIPRGLNMESVVEGAKALKAYGVDAINITDGARARLRMGPLAISTLVQTQAGIETVTHLATRDRNMISLQSELMSAHAMGIRNLLCVTGDPTNIGDYPQATSVFDIDSSGLIRAAKAMNQGQDLMGNAIEGRTSFVVACAANPKAENMDIELTKLEKKIDAGADVIFTQPIYEMRTLEEFLRRIENWHIPVMLGILPLRGSKHAEFLHNEIPGMNIPEELRHRFRTTTLKPSQLGIQIAVEFLKQAKTHVAGVYLMPPFKRYDIVPMVLQGAEISLTGRSA